MPYAQTNYQQKVGNGPYTIAEIGCFITAFSNLEEAFSISLDPATLNAFFTDHYDYLADPSDGAGVKDDLGWESIAAFDSTIHVSRIVDHGTEQTAGWPSTSNSIVKFYYTGHSGVKETHFCKVADPVAGTIVDSWDGKVKLPGSYYGQPVAFAEYAKIAPQPVIAPISQPPAIVEAPVAPPAPEVPPLPPAPVKPANTLYTKLETPLDLVTNKQPTNKWALDFPNDTKAVSVEQFTEATPFLAYGKAQRTDNDKPCYYMTQADFGEADTTGIPTNNNGVNTVDLSPAPTPEATSITAVPTPEATAPNPDGSENIKVTVKPTNWQSSYTKFLGITEYVANSTVTIHDIDDDVSGLPDKELLKGQTVNVAGIFDRDGVKYYRTAISAANGTWFGIPVTALTKVGDLDDDEFDKIVADLNKDVNDLTGHEKTIAKVATTNGFIQRLLHRNKNVKE